MKIRIVCLAHRLPPRGAGREGGGGGGRPSCFWRMWERQMSDSGPLPAIPIQRSASCEEWVTGNIMARRRDARPCLEYGGDGEACAGNRDARGRGCGVLEALKVVVVKTLDVFHLKIVSEEGSSYDVDS